MPRGLIFFAVPQEAMPFLRRARKAGFPITRRRPRLPSIPIEASVGPHHVVVSGMGHDRAVAAARAALEETEPEWLLTCGFAGGLDPSLGLGDVVHDSDPWFPLALEGLPVTSRPAVFHGSPTIIVSRGEKARLRAETSSDVVEMESGPIRDLCRARGVPSATLRVVSDVAGEDLPLDFNMLLTPDHDLHPGRMAAAIVRSPWKVASLMRFHRRVSLAARRLAEAVTWVLQPSKEGPA